VVRKKFNKKQIAIGIFFTLIVIFILNFYIWHQVESVRLGYTAGVLEFRLLSLRKEVEKLETKKTSLLALERVEKIAREELKLVSPKKEQIVYENSTRNSKKKGL